ncbi:MAG: hypothetical protein AB4352_00015 [Hormoscilla sp.]
MTNTIKKYSLFILCAVLFGIGAIGLKISIFFRKYSPGCGRYR